MNETTTTTPAQEVADAIRSVTAKAQKAWEDGRRAGSIDLDDLLEMMLAVADHLDPEYPEFEGGDSRNKPHATFADELVARCPNYAVSILRYDDGGIEVCWNIRQGATIARCARRTGLDDEMFFVRDGQVRLHIPAEAVGSEMI